jgi:hypothetical protein
MNFVLDATIASDQPLSKDEINYLKHVEEGKIIPLTLKERIKFTNDLLSGHNIELDGEPNEFLAYGYDIRMPKKIRNGKAGRIKGQGRGTYKRTEVEGGDSFNNIPIDNMPKSWAALFGK